MIMSDRVEVYLAFTDYFTLLGIYTSFEIAYEALKVCLNLTDEELDEAIEEGECKIRTIELKSSFE